jgi:hypothetical protein
MLLVPNYVYMKDYYARALGASHGRVMYLTPPSRYKYQAPKNVADAHGKVRKAGEHVTAPYIIFFALFNSLFFNQFYWSDFQVGKEGEHVTAPYMSFWYLDPHPVLSSSDLLSWWLSKQIGTCGQSKGLPSLLA